MAILIPGATSTDHWQEITEAEAQERMAALIPPPEVID